jgi:Uma2 family endonuclease
VDEYHQLIQTGILKSGERVELIHGWIIPKMPTNPTHASVVRRLDKQLQRLAGDAAVGGVQQPITTPDSEPEPDLTVSRGPENLYFTTHPAPEDICFVVEVSDTSLAYDRGEKLALYTRAGVSVYWVVSLENQTVEVYTKPRGERRPKYLEQTTYGLRESVPVTVAGKAIGAIRVREIVPPG